MPFCKGCGHSLAVRRFNEALVKLQLDPAHVCIVSDIGCIGLVDGLFNDVHTVHTTHGRSTAFATGIEIADSLLADSKLKMIVFIGDGGAMIGLLHLVQASLMNVDVTVLLCNNFLFGMTGGQNSAFTPLDFVTATTPHGSFTPPIDLWKVMESCQAGFIGRKLATDGGLSDIIAEAIAYPGFALVEIVELCTEYGLRYNDISGKTLRALIERHGQKFSVARRPARPEFGNLYRNRYPSEDFQTHEGVEYFGVPRYQHTLENPVGIILAGTAGERVQSSASFLCEAAVSCGLHTTQKNDNPVTQGSGYSFAEVILSPQPILYTATDRPHAVIVVSEEGLAMLSAKQVLENLALNSHLIIDSSLPVPLTKAQIYRLPFRKDFGPKGGALAAVAYYLKLSDILPIEALRAVFERLEEDERRKHVAALLRIDEYKTSEFS
ncbi:MAG: thiamine pyrophosphate-dependent enzyme [Bacteroidota bacterium]